MLQAFKALFAPAIVRSGSLMPIQTPLTRRAFFGGLIAAPAIIKLAPLMPISVFGVEDLVDPLDTLLEENFEPFRGSGFTAKEIMEISNAATDFYLRKAESFQQAVNSRPVWERLSAKKKTFPGGIELAVGRKFPSDFRRIRA